MNAVLLVRAPVLLAIIVASFAVSCSTDCLTTATFRVSNEDKVPLQGATVQVGAPCCRLYACSLETDQDGRAVFQFNNPGSVDCSAQVSMTSYLTATVPYTVTCSGADSADAVLAVVLRRTPQ